MNRQTTILTREGYHKLSKELEEIRENKRPKAVERLKKAREMGDLSENSEYVAAREELNIVDAKIAELEEILKIAEIKDKSADLTVIEVGDTIVVKTNGAIETYTLVGEHETNISEGKLSHKSPIGAALVGKHKGQTVQVVTPGGSTEYTVIDIK